MVETRRFTRGTEERWKSPTSPSKSAFPFQAPEIKMDVRSDRAEGFDGGRPDDVAAAWTGGKIDAQTLDVCDAGQPTPEAVSQPLVGAQQSKGVQMGRWL